MTEYLSIHSQADAFEREWKSGNRPDLKSSLQNCDPAQKVRLLELLIPLDVQFLAATGENVSAEIYAELDGQAIQIAQRAIDDLKSIEASRDDATLAPASFTETPTIAPGSQHNSSLAKEASTYETLSGKDRLLSYRKVTEVRKWRYGRILDATHPTLRRRVRIVVLDGPALSDPKIRESFMEQARSAGLVDHPNVESRVWEAVEDGEAVFVVLEPNENVPLNQLGPRTRIQKSLNWLYPNQTLAAVMLQALEGLSAIHGNGLQHGAISAKALRWNTKSCRTEIGDLISLDRDVERVQDRLALEKKDRELDLRDLGLAFSELTSGIPAEELRKFASASSTEEFDEKLSAANREVLPQIRQLIRRLVFSGTPHGEDASVAVKVVRELRELSKPTVEVASRWERKLTWLYDIPLLAIVVLAIWGIVSSESGLAGEQLMFWLGGGFVTAVVSIVSGFEILFGFTPGRAARKLRLINRTGRKATYFERTIRNVCRWGLIAAFAIAAYLAARLLVYMDVESLFTPEDIGYLTGSFLMIGSLIGVAFVYGCGFFNKSKRPFHELLSSTTWGVVRKSGRKLSTPGLSGRSGLASSLAGTPTPLSQKSEVSSSNSTLMMNLSSGTMLPAGGTSADDLDATMAPSTTPVATGLSSIATSLLSSGKELDESTETRIDQYEITGELGRGGMGTVLAATDTTLKRKVAIKMISPHLASGTEAIARFEQESQLAAQLSHENIGRVFGVGSHRGSPYLVMEYVDGESFEQAVARLGAMPKADAWDAILQAALGLAEAQKIGIVHRDIKPANLMVDRSGTVKVMDFGLSKLIGDDREDQPIGLEGETDSEHPISVALTMAGTMMGTPMYMSPEQAGGKTLDARTDIYSLGMTLYFLLTGKTPFDCRDAIELISKQCQEMPEQVQLTVPTLTRNQVKVLERMIAKEPDDRYPDYETLISDLRSTAPRELELANVQSRFCALVVTAVAAAIPASIVQVALEAIGGISEYGVTYHVLIFVIYTVGIWLYGQTPGKWLVGIEVVCANELPIRFWQSVLRFLAYPPMMFAQFFSLLNFQEPMSALVMLVWLASLLMIVFSRKKQGIHDLAVGTVVVRVLPETKIISKKKLRDMHASVA